jgi:hypothetical protein
MISIIGFAAQLLYPGVGLSLGRLCRFRALLRFGRGLLGSQSVGLLFIQLG